MPSLGTVIRRGRLSPPLLAALIAAGGTALVAVADPRIPGRYPICPLHALTGLDCPACGSLRAVHALTDGDLVAAAGFNLLLVIALPVIAVLWLRWLRAPADRPRPKPLISRRTWVFMIAAVAIFTVLRNTPAGAALAA